MNPWAIVGTLLAWGASVAGAGWWAYGAGKDRELASQAREDRAAQVATDAAAKAAARAIASIQVRHTTIRQELEREIQTREVLRDCRSGMDAVSLLNRSPGVGGAVPTGHPELPASGATR